MYQQLCALCGATALGVLIDVEKEGGNALEYAASRPDRGRSRLSDRLSVDPVAAVRSHLKHAHCGGAVYYDDTLGWACDKCRASSLQGWLDENLKPQPPAPLELELKGG